MPKVTIWIRNADYDKWTAIDNKPEWLHEHLDMPKATKEGYRSEHYFTVDTKIDAPPGSMYLMHENNSNPDLAYTEPEDVA